MTVSQYCMLVALALIIVAWAGAWFAGHRAAALQRVLAALVAQALAAVLLSFCTAHLVLSLVLAAILLAAAAWMVQSAGELKRASQSSEIA